MRTTHVPPGLAANPTVSHLPSLDRVASGSALSAEGALELLDADNELEADLCAAAAELRDRGRGRVITFSPKVFIPLTRLCRDFCGYCTFRQSPDESDGPVPHRRRSPVRGPGRPAPGLHRSPVHPG